MRQHKEQAILKKLGDKHKLTNKGKLFENKKGVTIWLTNIISDKQTKNVLQRLQREQAILKKLEDNHKLTSKDKLFENKKRTSWLTNIISDKQI